MPPIAAVWRLASVSEAAMTTVGDTPRDAKARSTPGPATELMARDACDNSAAMVQHSTNE